MPRSVGPRLFARGERARARALLGPLRRLQISRRSQNRCYKVTLAFAQEAQRRGGLADTLTGLEAQAAGYLEELWDNGDSRADACVLLAALQYFLRYRGGFRDAWNLLSVWNRSEIPYRVPPLPPEIVLALAGLALRAGRIDYVAALVVGFHCFLRTIEISRIRAGDFAIDASGKGVIALPDTKGGARRGAVENVVIDEPLVGLWMVRAVAGLGRGDLLLRGSLAKFRAWLSESLLELGVGEVGYTAYSLRRGGASYFYKCCGDLTRTLLRGRWENTKTARIYITEGLAALASMYIPLDARAAVAVHVERFYASCQCNHFSCPVASPLPLIR